MQLMLYERVHLGWRNVSRGRSWTVVPLAGLLFEQPHLCARPEEQSGEAEGNKNRPCRHLTSPRKIPSFLIPCTFTVILLPLGLSY